LIIHQTAQSRRQMPYFDIRQCSCLYGAWRRGREASFSPTRRRRLSRKCAESWDGLPLAIELAAGQVAALGLKNTAARLVCRLELLRLSHRTAVPEHRSLKGGIGLELQSAVRRREDCLSTHCSLSSAISPLRARGMSQANSAQAPEKFLTRSPAWSRSR